MEKISQKVTNNQEKSKTYKAQMHKLKLARKSGFHFEAIFILYAMLEDRLSSFLYHAGITNNTRDKITTNKKVRPHIATVTKSGSSDQLRMRVISSKVASIMEILVWAETFQSVESSLDYPDVLSRQIRLTVDIENMLIEFQKILPWCKERNELIHALMTRKTDGLEEKLCALTEEGERLCRRLDVFVRAFKKGNTIRRQFNIQ